MSGFCAKSRPDSGLIIAVRTGPLEAERGIDIRSSESKFSAKELFSIFCRVLTMIAWCRPFFVWFDATHGAAVTNLQLPTGRSWTAFSEVPDVDRIPLR